MKPDFSVLVTGSTPPPQSCIQVRKQPQLSSAVQEAKAGPMVPEPCPALGQNFRLAEVPLPLEAL